MPIWLKNILRAIEWGGNVSVYFILFGVSMSTFTGMWAHFKHLNDVEVFVICLCTFTAVLWLMIAIKKMFQKKQPNNLSKEEKKNKTDFEELARTLDGLRDSVEWGLEGAKGKDTNDPKYKELFLIQRQVHEIGQGLKRMYPQVNKPEEKKTDLQNFEDYLQRQLDWLEKLFNKKDINKRRSEDEKKHVHWQIQTHKALRMACGEEKAKEFAEECYQKHLDWQKYNKDFYSELLVSYQNLKDFKHNLVSVNKFDVRDLEKCGITEEP